MTLTKQTTIMMIVALTSIFFCNLIVSVYQSKTYFEEQLIHNTQDTATALGLSISRQLNKSPDTITLLQTISAVFDRGYFNQIYVRDNQGKTLVKRVLNVERHDIPDWFVSLVPIRNDEQSALIMNGWQQMGDVVVQSDSNVAYRALWHTTKKLFFLFLLTTLLIIAISILLINMMFNPLKKIIKQAEDIGKKNLYVVDQLPKLTELKQLAITMNSMVSKLKLFFTLQIEEIEQLRAKAYQDSLTGKGNRRYFFNQLDQYLSDETYFLPGFLFLIKLTGLIEFNQRHGYQQGDQLIIEVSHRLDALFSSHRLFLIARLDGPNFAVVLLEQDKKIISSLANDVSDNVDRFLCEKDKSLSCYIGVVTCHFKDVASGLLSKADKFLDKAQNQPGIKYCVEPDDVNTLPVPNPIWRKNIENAIQNKCFNFYYQPVKNNQDIYHNECFIKLLNDSIEIDASLFFPIVEQYDLGVDIDQLVFQAVSSTKEPSTFAINISASTILNDKNRSQFLSTVKQLTKHAKNRIHFEFSEQTLAKNMPAAMDFIEKLLELGHGVGLDRVGSTLTSLTYLEKLNLTYLKLDGGLSKEIRTNQDKLEMITNWITTSQHLDIVLIATAIETEAQWHPLKELGITYFQGNYIQSPYKLTL